MNHHKQGILVLALVLAAAACSASPDASAPATTLTPARATATPTPDPLTLRTFDSPTRFEGDPVPVTLPALEANVAGDFASGFLLSGPTAFGVTATSIGAVDLATGGTTWETRFPHAPDDAPVDVFYAAQRPGAPVPSDDGATLYAVLPVHVPGSGTAAGRDAFEVVAVAAATGEPVWDAQVDDEDTVLAESGPVRVEAVDDVRVVVSAAGQSAALSAVDGAVLWSRPGTVQAVTADAVLVVAEVPEGGDGPGYPQLLGLDPTTGDVLWSGGDEVATAVSSAAALATDEGLVVTAGPYTGADPWTAVIDPRTGEVVRDLDVTLERPVRDGDLLYDVGGGLRALDPRTLEPLWTLPTDGRVAVERPVVFGGHVYGRVPGASVVLDGRTGEDVTVDVPGSFVAVNEYGALMYRDKAVVFVPATA
ncbi:outer membrane protein assembly factor BamB family protein [Cellulomonas palmilytica]|uniref:outer membrane protein assembly factor BamB family protein n=1 Tax=Cellulomonas palmilytica TaxID=2608402 RepID=UPI001F17953E|nr:PQQ-binding-like beta-propeller repeat protein [Cellulomonas palmilytica]UJP40010.1 PQQ-binding-like beta-propeller repeat protein [Cellulomonas palmilytica]